MDQAVLAVENLRTVLKTREGLVQAVNDVSIRVNRGEIVGIVGESGCGKSMTAMSIMGLVPSPPGQITAGRILLDGVDLRQLGPAQMRAVRGRKIAMIFQDPMTFLNPVLTIGTQIAEVLKAHTDLDRQARNARVLELLSKVRIPDPARVAAAYPHQLSGGMRQRILIASAISCNPDLIIADEPTTALDVTVQAQIMDLLKQIIADIGSSLLLITHDLGVVAETCDRVYVMYAGEVIEEAPAAVLFSDPRHPYTRGLLGSVLRIDRRQEELFVLEGTVPNLVQVPSGCKFHDRCTVRESRCEAQLPPWSQLAPTAGVACWREV